MEAITNSTVLIFLAKIARLDLLKIFKSIHSVNAVYLEVLSGKEIPASEKALLEVFFKKSLKIETPAKIQILDLGDGETGAISLCVEKKQAVFLSDDKKARRIAKFLGIDCIGTIGIILKNLKEKNISKEEAKNIVNQIIKSSYYLSVDVYAEIIELIEKY